MLHELLRTNSIKRQNSSGDNLLNISQNTHKVPMQTHLHRGHQSSTGISKANTGYLDASITQMELRGPDRRSEQNRCTRPCNDRSVSRQHGLVLFKDHPTKSHLRTNLARNTRRMTVRSSRNRSGKGLHPSLHSCTLHRPSATPTSLC